MLSSDHLLNWLDVSNSWVSSTAGSWKRMYISSGKKIEAKKNFYYEGEDIIFGLYVALWISHSTFVEQCVWEKWIMYIKILYM